MGIRRDELDQSGTLDRGGARGLLSPGVGGWWPPPQLVDLHLHSLHFSQELLLGVGDWRRQVTLSHGHGHCLERVGERFKEVNLRA